MDLTALEAALPAEVVTAAAAAGLTPAAKVYVARDRRTGDQATDPECWILPVGWEVDPPTLSRDGVAFRYVVTVYKAAETLAQRRAFLSSLQGYFHGFHRPTSAITRFDHWTVENLDFDPHLAEGPDGAVRCELVAHGEGEEETA